MDRCVNCNIKSRHNVHRLRQLADDEKVLLVISQWKAPHPVTSSDYVCKACWNLAQTSSAGELRQLGHRNVCVRCGRSIASRVSHLLHHGSIRESKINYLIQRWITPRTVEVSSRICHNCWVTADRAATRMIKVPSSSSQRNSNIRQLPVEPPPMKKFKELEAEQSISSGNEDTCYPQYNAPVTHTAESIQEDQIKVFIVKVFHYLEHEFEVLKKMDAKMILINLSKLQYRTAMATGVSETTVLEILQEEARRNAAMREMGPQNDGKPEVAADNAGKPRKRRRVCKKQSLAESSSEASDGDIEEVGHSSVAQDTTIEPEGEMLVVKAEPFEYYNEEPAINIEPVNATAINKDQNQKDPISLDVKSESPVDDEMNVSDDTRVAQPASSKRRRISRKSGLTSTDDQDLIDPLSSDVKVEPPDGEMNMRRTQAEYCTSGASSSHRRVIELDGRRPQGKSCTTGASSSHRRVIELDGRSLLRVGEVKVESENEEEGFS